MSNVLLFYETLTVNILTKNGNIWQACEGEMAIYIKLVREKRQYMASLGGRNGNIWQACEGETAIYGKIVREKWQYMASL